jgi:inward rectifier potassium channel
VSGAHRQAAAPTSGADGGGRPHRAHRRPYRRRIQLGDRQVVSVGLPRMFWQDLYHLCMTVSWGGLFSLLATFYLALNLVFATLYSLAPGCIANLNPAGFAGYFFFSVETSATVGYGDMHPQTLFAHLVASCEMFIGMMSLALLTGVMFARFSLPRARIIFARYAVIRPIDGQPTLMLRAANGRQNVIVDASARLRLLRNETSAEGYRIRRIRDLTLVRDNHPLFLLGWNLMHVIDETSPLLGETHDSLVAGEAQLILTMRGTDETTGQEVMARTSFAPQALRWNHGFRDILRRDDDGDELVDYAHFHDVVALPQDAAGGASSWSARQKGL